MESYKHRFAKETVAGWLREARDLNCDIPPLRPVVDHRLETETVFTEYPVCINAANSLMGLCSGTWQSLFGGIPSYETCIKSGLLPLIVYDVAKFNADGFLAYGIEVVHRHDVNRSKADFHRRIHHECMTSPDLYRIEADWVLSQCGRPRALEITRMRLPEKTS